MSNSHSLLTLCLLALATSWAPTTTHAQPARSSPCLITEKSIYCTGAAITDASLLLLKDELHLRYSNMYFQDVHIAYTEVTKIYSGTFADVQFESIYIQDNDHLTLIAEDAFSKQTTKSLMIINNKLLKTNEVYAVTDTLHVTEYVDLDGNALLEVPSHAFNEHLPLETFYENVNAEKSGNLVEMIQKIAKAPPVNINEMKKVNFKKLGLTSNHIERINSNAFHLLESCSQIFLNLNQLKHIQTQGFNLHDHLGSQVGGGANDIHLSIYLESNLLTKDSFEPDFIYMNNYTNVFVDLSANQITELHKEVWEPLLAKHSITVEFTGNPIECASVAWLKLEGNEKLWAKTKGINC